MSNITVDITPDKSLIKKLGLVGYRTEQAVAELIDNSIDARLGDTVTVSVILNFKLGQIKVSDDGCGMDSEGIKNALTVAKETKKDNLGQFGLGLKSACSSLGKTFTICTTTPESDSIFEATYNEEQWINDSSKDWTNFEIKKTVRETVWHGTNITIGNIKVPLYPNQLLNFRQRFGIRYGPYIERGQVRILVNSRPCKPSFPKLADDTRHLVDIQTPSGKMSGWIGLLARRSIKGDYGIHLYRNGRLISAFDKFGIKHHPNAARVIGELSLDHVPVNFHKTGFLTESPRYREAVSEFMGNSTVKTIMRQASSPKEGMSNVESVLALDQSHALPPLDGRMSAKNAKLLLRDAGKFVQQKGDTVFNFEFDDSDTFGIETTDDGIRIGIGRNNPAFSLFKNPLFLIGMIRIEAELAAGDLSHRLFIERRNAMLSEFVRNRIPKQVGKGKSKKEIVPLPRYSLHNDLVEIHDYLKEAFEHDFQFTGISTLSPFLHHSHSKIVYMIYTVPGAGQELMESILSHEVNFTILLNPHKQEIMSVLDVADNSKFIVIREYRGRLSPTWAEPEKSWLDLYFEVTRDKIPFYHDELILILDELLDAGLAKPTKLRSLARRRQILKEIEEYLPD